MLYLYPNTETGITVTLYEKCANIYNPYFTWSITNCDTKQEYVFTNDDFSNAPWYYNQFTFSVVYGATYGATAGIIPATIGEYYYRVYEMTNQYDLNITNAVKEVESGILNIVGSQSAIGAYTKADNTVAVYQKIINN